MIAQFKHKVVLISIVLVSLSSVNQWTMLPLNNTVIWWIVYALILFFLVRAKSEFYDNTNIPKLTTIKLYLIWNIICIVRGLFVSEDYWDLKNLIGASMILLLPLVVYIASNTYYVQKIVALWMKFVLPSFLFIAPFIDYGAYGRYLFPASFALLFFPVLKNKWKFIMVGVALVVILADLGARSNVLKFLVPLGISFLYYARFYLGLNWLLLLRSVLIILPFLLFFLGISGQFNVFNMSDYTGGNSKVGSNNKDWEDSGDLTADTRTFLYVEVLNSAIKYQYIWFGRTPARGNESLYFGASIDKELGTNKMERHGNEVSILNVFTWTGVVGVLIYFLVFLRASFLAIKKSNNWFIKLIGIYICFRWSYAWVEDFGRFDLSTIFLWLCLGMCFSYDFRSMTDKEFTNWIRGVFDKRYRKVILQKKLIVTK